MISPDQGVAGVYDMCRVFQAQVECYRMHLMKCNDKLEIQGTAIQ